MHSYRQGRIRGRRGRRRRRASKRHITFQDILTNNKETKLTWFFDDKIEQVFHTCSVRVVEHAGVFHLEIQDERDDDDECKVGTYVYSTVKDQMSTFGNSLALLMNKDVAGALEEFAKLKTSRSISDRSVFEFLKKVSEPTLLSLFYGLLDVAPVGRFVRHPPESDDE